MGLWVLGKTEKTEFSIFRDAWVNESSLNWRINHHVIFSYKDQMKPSNQSFI